MMPCYPTSEDPDRNWPLLSSESCISLSLISVQKKIFVLEIDWYGDLLNHAYIVAWGLYKKINYHYVIENDCYGFWNLETSIA